MHLLASYKLLLTRMESLCLDPAVAAMSPSFLLLQGDG
jgi:hypothetical protein